MEEERKKDWKPEKGRKQEKWIKNGYLNNRIYHSWELWRKFV